MPKLTKQPPKYGRHKPTDQAVVTLNGKRTYLGKYGSKESIARYQRVICEWQASHEHGSPSIRPDPALRADLRICELLAAYLEFARGYYLKNGEPTGELSNMKDAIKPINKLFEVERVAEFGPTKLKLARDRMVAHTANDHLFRIDHLRATTAKVKFLSLEPLLGPLRDLNLDGIDWVIVGGESGLGARPMAESWVTDIRDLCVAKGVPFFFKQWGGVKKKLNGRDLEGRVWGEMPE